MSRLTIALGALSIAAAALLGGTAFAADVPTIRFVVPFGGGATYTTAGLNAVVDKLNPLLETRIGAHVELVPIPISDYNQRMTLMNSAREPYDIAMTAPWTNNFYLNVAQGNFMPLNDYVGDVPDLEKSVSPELQAVGSVGGKLYGIPIEQMFPKTFGPAYNVALGEKYGVKTDDITSWADLTPIFKRMVEGEGAGFYAAGGRLSVNAEQFGYDPVVAGNVLYAVVKMDDPELKVVNLYETPEYRDLMKLRRQWQEDGLTDPNPMNRDAVRAKLTAQTMAFAIDSAQDRPTTATQFGVPFVAKRLAPLVLTTGAMNASMMAVSADSQHPVEALKLITLLHSDQEVFRLFAEGIEGVSYGLRNDGSGLYEKLPGASDYWPDVDWVWGNSYLAAPRSEADLTTVEWSKRINAEATPSAALGFAFDVSPVETEFAGLSTLLPSFEALESGQVADVDGYLDAQIAALKAAGMDRVQDELRRQLDAWKATR